jgi:hypothetical protein
MVVPGSRGRRGGRRRVRIAHNAALDYIEHKRFDSPTSPCAVTPGRNTLEDLPEILQRLRAQAERVRTRIGELEAGGARVEARENAERHLTDSVTAREAIRLQLHRLYEGIGTLEGVTAELAAAREVGEAVDRLPAGRREVEEVLERPPAVSTGG